MSRVDPSDIAPPGYLNRDPDPTAFFEPGGNPSISPDGLSVTESVREPDRVPDPPPPRPEVEYVSDRGSRQYRLMYPVRIDGLTITEVTVNPPALWDIQDWAAGRLQTNYELMARMVNLDPVKLGAFRWPDVEAILTISLPMLPEAIQNVVEQNKKMTDM